MSVSTLSQIKSLFRSAGVRTLYVKRLAEKQDNEKNQVFLGREVSELTNLFPARLSLREPSQSELKRKSDVGRPITEATLDFVWMNTEGERFNAPNARLIDYFQYPEARLSGFLQGCKWAPRAIRRNEQALYGERVLILGSNAAGEVIALLLTEKEDAAIGEIPDLEPSGASSVLGVMTVDTDRDETPADLLATKLRAIIDGGWHRSVRNKAGEIIPFKGNQGAGYTLEALLGVETNALKEPDILGHEVKSYRSDKLSLMTPTADGGPEGELSFRDFMEQYGLPAKKADGSLRFTGVARAGKTNPKRGLSIRVTGYDTDTDLFSTNPDQIRVEQYFASSGAVLSSWSLPKLTNSWNRKHAFAVYVRAEKGISTSDGSDEYRFLSPFYMCAGTNVFRLLRAIAAGHVYYDPAHVIDSDGQTKVRPQWRISTRKFDQTLGKLYQTVRVVT